MGRPSLSLTGAIKSQGDLREQYKDSSNLSARAAIYKFGERTINWHDWVFDHLLAELPAGASVLEAGCGPGMLWKQVLPRVPSGWWVLLTDLMQGMIDEAKTALQHDPRFSFQIMNADQLDLPDGSIDAVVANHMLYHMPDLQKALREIHRVLRPGGKLLAATNGGNHLVRLEELIREFLDEYLLLPGKLSFSLDNGEQYLQQHFAPVVLRRVSSVLRITETEAVVRYVLSASSGAKEKISGDKLLQLHRHVESEITSRGAFAVQTDSGFFLATK